MRRAALAAGLAVSACAPVPAPHAVHVHPTILSINPCTDALVTAVADRAQIAALSAYSSDPAQSSMDVALARSLPATTGTVEEALALRPDVVVAGGLTPPATRAALARAGLPLVEVGIARNVRESEAQVRQVAALAGHADRGEALVARIESALRAAAPPPSPPVTALVWQAGGMVPGRGTLIADLLARTGFVDFAAGRGFRQADILPLELLLADPPQVVMVAGVGRQLAHPALRGLNGTRRFALDPSLEWCGGPTIIRAAARLSAIRRAATA